MSVYETIKMSPLLGLQGSGGGLAYLAGLAGGDKVYVDDVFGTFLWNGTWGGTGSAVTINNGIDLTGEGGLVWTKHRNYGNSHQLYDTERGAGKPLYSNITNGEGNNPVFSSFNSNGFSLTAGSANLDALNGGTSQEYASWTFRKAPGFFDVVKFTGNGSTGLRAINHNLGCTPAFIIVKNASGGATWGCWHKDLTSKNYYFPLNDTDQERDGTQQLWDATDTTFSFHSGIVGNGSGVTFIAYLFASEEASFGTGGNESIIKCGSYGITSGFSDQTIDLGFEPQWLLIKRTDAASSWSIVDNMRGLTDGETVRLRANLSNAEQTTTPGQVLISATGFTVKEGTTDYLIGPSSRYVYMAIRRPNKPPTAATEVFHTNYLASNGKDIKQITGFPIDLLLYHYGDAVNAIDRVRGKVRSRTPYNYAEGAFTPDMLDYSDGFKNESFNGSVSLGYSFKRAPGFFDIVAYQGTGSARTVNHNLKVKPELMIIKCRTDTRSWIAYSSYSTAEKFLQLDDPFGSQDSAELFNDTEPTATQFTVGTSNSVNNANSTTGKYIAYLFATLPGISKIGSFTGTGNAINVDCGFANGARFVLIKRADPAPAGAGSWYVWDTARGIVSGNDPYILLDSPVAQVTNTDYIDPLGTGFTVTASAPAALNASGGNYLFFAIA